MSKKAWATFLGSIVFTTSTITFVHYDQEQQKAVYHYRVTL